MLQPDPAATRRRPLPARCEVAVVGAGLAGLAAALRLRTAGRDVVVLEADDGVGGRVRTDVVEGFRLDRGFQVLLTAYPELREGFDLEALRLRRFAPGVKVWTGEHMEIFGDPVRRPGTLAATLRSSSASWPDKLRLARQRITLPRIPAQELLRQPDVTTEEALRGRGFSSEVIDAVLRPFIGGIELDPSLGTSVRMSDLVIRTLLRGDVALPAAGMGAVPRQIAEQLDPASIHLGRRVVAVTAGAVTLADGSRVDAGDVVVATDGPTASALLGLPPVRSNPATCVWFAAEDPPVSDPYLIVDGTGRGPALNVAPVSVVAPEYSPDHRALIAAACPGICDPQAEAGVRDQLRSIWGIRVDSWRHLRTDSIAHGQPRQYPPFHPKKPVAVTDGVYVCGDHRDTASIQGALFSGRRCAEAVLAGS